MLNIKARQLWIIYIKDYTAVKLPLPDDKLLSMLQGGDYERWWSYSLRNVCRHLYCIDRIVLYIYMYI